MNELIPKNNSLQTVNNELMVKVNNIIENCYEIDSQELVEVTNEIVTNVKLKSLKRAVDKVCMNLASVGEPKWNADAKDIAWNNQKRLTTIYQLLDTYNMLEKDVKNIKKNKNNCIENSDYLYGILLRVQELLGLEQKFKEIKLKEIKDTIEFYQILDELHHPELYEGRILLEEGEEND